jgi:hypothetical protein
LSDDRFDALTKAAASTTSRRRALQVLGGGLAAALFGGFFSSKAPAGGTNCLPAGAMCKDNGDCCPTALGTSCCCRSSKFETTGICADKDVCTDAGGICH